MPSNEEKKRRKELLRTWEQNEHKQQEDNLPVGKENLSASLYGLTINGPSMAATIRCVTPSSF